MWLRSRVRGDRRPHRRQVAALTSLLILLLLGPHPDAVARQGEDPLRTLGADSPLCKQALDAAARADCRATGAIEHPYPLDHYRFDWHITTGVTHITENFLAMVQWVCSIAWMASLYLLKGVLLMFQWAFSLDLLGRSMSGARATLSRLHDTTLGQPWFIAAIAVLGLWGIWRGLVQRQATATVAGLGAALVMMVLALIMIDRPAETVGAASRGANDVSLSFLSGASEGTLAHPQLAISRSSEQLFDTVVLRPWCALDFGDVDWCLAHAPGDRMTHAERWLRFAPDTPQRNAEYNAVFTAGAYKPDDPALARQLAGYRPTKADQPKVDMQGKSKTVTRAVLLGLILIGQLGAIALIGWLAFRVLLQGILTLVLLLLAPVMLLAPAFGEAGRTAFRKWGLRLIAAVCSKAIYALLLAIVLAIATMIAELNNPLPWAVLWLVEGVFWWGVIVKRKELLAFASTGERGDSVAGLYYRGKMAQAGIASVGGAAAAVVGGAFALGRRGTGSGRELARSRPPGPQGPAPFADRRGPRARARLDGRSSEPARHLAQHKAARRELRTLNKELRRYDRRATRAAPNAAKLDATPKERQLAARRAAVRQRLMPPAELAATRRSLAAAARDHSSPGAARTGAHSNSHAARVGPPASNGASREQGPAARSPRTTTDPGTARPLSTTRAVRNEVQRDPMRPFPEDRAARGPATARDARIANPEEVRERRMQELDRRKPVWRDARSDRQPER